jgi:hypothetical protein
MTYASSLGCLQLSGILFAIYSQYVSHVFLFFLSFLVFFFFSSLFFFFSKEVMLE